MVPSEGRHQRVDGTDVDINDPQQYELGTVLPFNRGKSCLFSLGEAALQQLLARVPLYLMLVDVAADSETPSRLLGTTAIDLSDFLQVGALPARDSSVGYRRGLFTLFDLMVRTHLLLP